MWALETDDGQLISERECLWPDLPPDICVRRLVYRDNRGRMGQITDYTAYGFQRFSLSVPGATVAHAGTQLIGVREDVAVITEINEVTGEVSRQEIPASELTYSRELLRDGVRG